MSIYQTILADLKSAMKFRDQQRLNVLRSLKSAIFEKEVSQRKGGEGEQLTDEEVVDVLMKSAKQRKDSIQQYKDAGRTDLAEQEQSELDILESYLPDMLSEDEIRDIANEVISDTGASGMQDMGKVMGQIMSRVKGKADGGLVNKVVKEQLSSQ